MQDVTNTVLYCTVLQSYELSYKSIIIIKVVLWKCFNTLASSGEVLIYMLLNISDKQLSFCKETENLHLTHLKI